VIAALLEGFTLLAVWAVIFGIPVAWTAWRQRRG
jgi:hypothetical protein